MKNTCLFSFYEYIFSEWLRNKQELPEYERIFSRMSESSETLGITKALDERKRAIWKKTRALLQLKSETEQKKTLAGYQQKAESCGLCMKCIHCEETYWNEVQKELFYKPGKLGELEEKSPLMLPENIRRLLEQRERPVEIYLDRHRRRNFLEENCLLILKAFSSSTPILLNYADGARRYSGGGFYVRWNGCGIAIDPGYKFVENLHEAGFSVLDVDVVVITHEHIDHSNDIRLLEDLHYHASVNNKDYEYNWDPDHFSINRDSIPPHKITWYLDSVTCEVAQFFSRKQSGFNPLCNDVYCVNIDETETELLKEKFLGSAEVITASSVQISTDVVLRVFPTRHEQYTEGERTEFFHHTFGCVLECISKDSENRCIGYTSDTSVKDTDVYADMKKSFESCQIVIANISGIYEDDVLLQHEKSRHLGYYGCYKIAYDILRTGKGKLKYYLLSEFSNQVSDIRYDISKYLQEELNETADLCLQSRPLILPAEVALTINLDTFGIKCSSCKRYSDSIYVIRPLGENQELKYICKECIYTNSI